jgi:rhodanese-related sulfurtransferase
VLSRTVLLTGALSLALAGGVARAAERGSGGVAGVKPGVVDGATAHELVAAGVKVVDVRTPGEFAEGHVPGAINIPHDQMASRHREIGPPSTPVLLYCRTGRRTEIAARTLREKGFSTLYDLQAYDKWLASEPR